MCRSWAARVARHVAGGCQCNTCAASQLRTRCGAPEAVKKRPYNCVNRETSR